jgi:outer membrane biosynthesis protein TonB
MELLACTGSPGPATAQAPLAAPAAPSSAAPAPQPSPSVVRDDVFTLHRPTANDAEPAPAAPSPNSSRRPTIRVQPVQVSGGLPAEVIQRIVRQHATQFRECYEAGLATNPRLGGYVGVKFTIDASGNAVNVAEAGSYLADREVISCVLAAFPGTIFPRPEAGVVQVVVPMSFMPPEP